MYGDTHWQKCPPTPCIQEPPFWQGLLWHVVWASGNLTVICSHLLDSPTMYWRRICTAKRAGNVLKTIRDSLEKWPKISSHPLQRYSDYDTTRGNLVQRSGNQTTVMNVREKILRQNILFPTSQVGLAVWKCKVHHTRAVDATYSQVAVKW